MNTQKAADAGVLTGWFVWIISHLPQINAGLQTILFVVSIGGGIAAWRYYSRRTPK